MYLAWEPTLVFFFFLFFFSFAVTPRTELPLLYVFVHRCHRIVRCCTLLYIIVVVRYCILSLLLLISLFAVRHCTCLLGKYRPDARDITLRVINLPGTLLSPLLSPLLSCLFGIYPMLVLIPTALLLRMLLSH